MNSSSVFNEQILGDKLSKLNSTQQCIEIIVSKKKKFVRVRKLYITQQCAYSLSHWCIFHRSKAEQVVATWDKQFHSSEMVQKIPLLYLANDILQNSKRKGNEFVTEFWKVLPSALKDVVEKGDDHGKNAVSRLVGIWEERKVFGSRAQSLKDIMLGVEMPPPLELGKKRSRIVKVIKRDSRSIRTKLSIGGAAEKIVSAFHLVQSERLNEDEGMSKCKSVLHRMKKMETDVDVALTKANDPSRKTLAKELEESENLLKQSIDKLKLVETNRVALVSQLRDVLHEQESELENLRTQIQVATAHVEEASKTRELLNKDCIRPSTSLINGNAKTSQSTKKSAAAIAAEVADKLAASTSSQYIMTSVLSTFAAEEAKNAGLMKSSTPSTSTLNGSTSKSENPVPISDPNNFMPGLNNPAPNNPYQQISNSQALYHSIPNPSLQYMQPSGGIVGSYDYGSLPPFPPGPSGPAPLSYVVNPMVPLNQQSVQMTQQQPLIMGHHMSTLPQQQHIPLSTPPSFRPLAPVQAPGMVYYTHPYQSQ